MRPAWDAICAYALMLAALVLALVIPYPHNGTALIAIALAVAGGALLATSLNRRRRDRS